MFAALSIRYTLLYDKLVTADNLTPSEVTAVLSEYSTLLVLSCKRAMWGIHGAFRYRTAVDMKCLLSTSLTMAYHTCAF